MQTNCRICGTEPDLFSSVTGGPVCAICTIRFFGGLPATAERIANKRAILGLAEGEFLDQDRVAEARRILGCQ